MQQQSIDMSPFFLTFWYSDQNSTYKHCNHVAQLVERSRLIPEVRGSNPIIAKNVYWQFTVNYVEKTK